MVFIYTTCANMEEARKLGKLMIDQKVAACVDMWPIHSMYNWEGKFEDHEEAMLLITTLEARLQGVDAIISKNHSYSTPLVAGVDVRRINPEYREWLVNEIA